MRHTFFVMACMVMNSSSRMTSANTASSQLWASSLGETICLQFCWRRFWHPYSNSVMKLAVQSLLHGIIAKVMIQPFHFTIPTDLCQRHQFTIHPDHDFQNFVIHNNILWVILTQLNEKLFILLAILQRRRSSNERFSATQSL